MQKQTPNTDLFKKKLRNSLKQETEDLRPVKVEKHANVYTCGDKSDNVYFIESGQIKLRMLSRRGKECLIAIYTSGDIFGELCLSEYSERLETATAMEDTYLKVIPCSKFFQRLTKDSLLEGFVRYLAVRVSDQQKIISNLVTEASEQRLGKTLLQLAGKLGKKDPRSIRFKHKITQEELSEMVGTTRSRISQFMQSFRKHNLIEMTPDHCIIVKEKNLTAYLNKIPYREKPPI